MSGYRLPCNDLRVNWPFDVVHYQAANLRTDIASKFVVFMLCAPDVEMMTYLDDEEIAARAHLRHPAAVG